MALIPSFTIAVTSNPSSFTLTDTSAGSDAAIASRLITLYLSSGAVFGSPIPWPGTVGGSITVSPLSQDLALNIRVDWLNSSGASIYNTAQIYAFTQFGEAYFYQLTQKQAAPTTPPANILLDQNYLNNKMLFRLWLDSAVQAINVGQDIVSAQNCINLYQNYLNNPSLYF
jgi:hypothetical protein